MSDNERRGVAGSTGVSNDQSSAPPVPPQQYQYAYGTFQGVPSQNPASQTSPSPPLHQEPVVGFPQPAPPPGVGSSPSPYHYPPGYQTVPGYAVAEGRPVELQRLRCCGLGIGWFLFIIGFFLGTIPWYAGSLMLLCGRGDRREKPGLVACLIASIIAIIAIIVGAIEGSNHHHHHHPYRHHW